MQPAAARAREPALQPNSFQSDPEPVAAAPALRLLVIDDSPLDHELLVATLERENIDVQALRVQTESQLADALQAGPWDAVVADQQLQRLSSQQALALVRGRLPHCPFIIVSSVTGEEVAVVAMRRGADDYLVKGRLARLVPALFNAMAAAQARRERAEAREALLHSEAQLRELLAHLETVVDEERAEIAREVHDEIGSSLTALRLDMNWIVLNGDAACASRAGQAMQTLAQVMDAALRLQQRLRPAVLDQGLDAALRWLAEDTGRRSGLAVSFQCNARAAAVAAVAAPAALAAYRTLQEALNNIIKHAGASQVDVSLVLGADQLSLEIVDDGRGIRATDRLKPTSFGLRGMAERAERLGGWIEVGSLADGAADEAGRGTVIFLTLPLAVPASAAAPATPDGPAAGSRAAPRR
jgi:signal transduction histidine kinase